MLNIQLKGQHQKFYFKKDSHNASSKYEVLSKTENDVKDYESINHPLQLNTAKLRELWAKLLLESDSFYVRKFLDINSEGNCLFDENFLERLIKFSSSKLLLSLWCKLAYFILSINYNEKPTEFSRFTNYDELLSKLKQFEDFVQIIEVYRIPDSNLYQLQQFTDAQFNDFVEIISESDSKLLQFEHAFPPIEDVGTGLELLRDGYIFVSNEIVNLAKTISVHAISDADTLLELVLQTEDVEQLRNISLLYLLNHCTDIVAEFSSCIETLSLSHNTRKFSAQAYLIITKLSLQLIHGQEKKLATWANIKFLITNSVSLYNFFGDKLFYILEQQKVNNNTLLIFEKVYSLLEYFLKRGVSPDLSNCSNVEELSGELEKLQLRHIKSINQLRDLNSVLSDFKGPNQNVEFPLNDQELHLIKEQFILIEKFERQFSSIPLTRLNRLIDEIKVQLHYTHTSLPINLKEELVCKLIAIAMRAFIHFFHICPYDVQRLCVLAMLLPRSDFKGVLAQVKTGEGKSTIISLLSVVLACQGKAVDIITSTEYLATRDEAKYKDFFSFFGITTNNACGKNISQDNFSGQIMYGTNYNFEFSILFDKLYLLGNRVHYADQSKSRPLQVAIIDEVDNMLVDKALNSARISYPGNSNLETLYTSLYDLIKVACANQRPDKLVKLQCRDLADKYEISDIRLEKLINSAYQACFEYHLDTHYCIRKAHNDSANSSFKIVIIDRDTGRLNEESRWQHGLHQFLEYKHGLPIIEDSHTLGALSHPAFFSYYKEIYGVTGTIGTWIERKEVEEGYRLASFDVPTYRPTLRKQLDGVICKNQNQFRNLLLRGVDATIKYGRPCLILCPSIEVSKDIYSLLKINKVSNTIQILNDTQYQDEEFIVSNAGECSSITIATNAAGRGTDIEIKENALRNGGLHVIFTFFANNDRVEAQGAGRAGRQGNPGSYQILVPHDDEILAEVLKNQKSTSNTVASSAFNIDKGDVDGFLSANVNLEHLYAFREQRILKESKFRQIYSKINLIQHEIFEEFCDYYLMNSNLADFNRHEVLSKWAEFYTQLEDIPIRGLEGDEDVDRKISEYASNLDRLFIDFFVNNFKPTLEKKAV